MIMTTIDDKILSLIKKEAESFNNKIINIEGLADKYNIPKKDMHYQYIIKFGESILETNQKAKIQYLNRLIDKDDEKSPQRSYIYAHKLGYESDAGLQGFIKKHIGMTFREYYMYRKQTAKKE